MSDSKRVPARPPADPGVMGTIRRGTVLQFGVPRQRRVPPPGPEYELIKGGWPSPLRLDVSADCRLSNYVERCSLNACCWMHQPTCPNGRPVLQGFRRWWVWNDGATLVLIGLAMLVVMLLAAVLLAAGLIQALGVRS